MDLSTCTPGQLHVVTTLDRPLVVAAGAGSGKTFTLTQRIVSALLPDEQGNSALNSIDELIAITYTNKAAAELKSRIKLQLLEEGLEDEALKVDDAWISTIHGMCSRLLKEHALEFGIDPAYELMLESDFRAIFIHALENVFNRESKSDDAFMLAYLSGKPLLQGFKNSESIEQDVCDILDIVHCLPEGFDAFVEVPCKVKARTLLERQLELVDAFIAHTSDWKMNATEAKYCSQAESAALALNEALQQIIPDFDEPNFDSETFLDLMLLAPATSAAFHSKKPDADFCLDYRISYAQNALTASLRCGSSEVAAKLRFAHLVEAEYKLLKGKSRLDTDDLISLTVEQLDAHPGISEWCRNHFKLVMVDEFQDTNWVQVDLISRLCKEDFSNFCFVGDAQQSIYKFRGADVDVFFDVRDDIADKNDSLEIVELPDNFRSHADVLSLVDKIFAQRDFFGERFLHLEPKGAVNKSLDPVFEELPRIEFALSTGKPLANIRRLHAEAIAQRFSKLRAAGESPASMVILLGKMSHAADYVAALRKEGFQSIISGGSVFASSIEVQQILELLRWFANPLAANALLSVLLSRPFYLDEISLEALSRSDDDESLQSIAQGFLKDESSCATRLDEVRLNRLKTVRRILLQAAHIAQYESCSRALRYVFTQSGWASYLESGDACQMGVAGNILKTLHIIERLEKGRGVAETAKAFEDHLSYSKETPGSITSESSEFVRIMTIHSSKGLQFPHVALAELRDGSVSRFTGTQKIGKQFVSLKECKPSNSNEYDKLKKFLFDSEELIQGSLNNLSGAYKLVKDLQAQDELDEAQRLLYVGMTRPVKSLLTCFSIKETTSKTQKTSLFTQIQDVLGLYPDGFPAVKMIDYGGSAPARVVFTDASELEDEDRSRQSESIWVYQHPIIDLPQVSPSLKESKIDFYSYSSLQHELNLGDSNLRDSINNESNNEVAVDLGTCFHLLAQRSILDFTNQDSNSYLRCPGKETVDRLVIESKLSSSQQQRLNKALGLWFNSDLAKKLVTYDEIHAEVPFVLKIDTTECFEDGFYLEGEMDVFAHNKNSSKAIFIDYKTGGDKSETYEDCCAKHLLQAQCYAYALLNEGFTEVEAHFVRVEQESDINPGQPQIVTFEFQTSDYEQLANAIIKARP